MSLNPDFDETVVALQPRFTEVDAVPPELTVPNEPAVILEPASAAEAAETHISQDVHVAARRRPRWVVPVAIAAVGVIASGTLGYFLSTTTGQRDAARHQLAVTQAALASTKDELSSAQSEAAAKKVTANYVSLFVASNGVVQTDYENIIACNNYSECRTAAQQLLADLQAFQQARSSAQLPAALSSSDGMLGDALSAAIAGTQEFINGMDNNDMTKVKDGGSKVDAAMLSLAKSEAALGTELR